MKKIIERTLICSVLSTLVLMPTAFADNINVAINQPQQTNLSLGEDKKELNTSYYTVKDFASLRNTINIAKSGDVIILVGDNTSFAGDSLTVSGKELTVISNDRSHRINVNSIMVENGTLNLSIPGAKSPSELHVSSKFFLNNSTLNLYDGAYIDNFDVTKNINRDYLINANNTDSKINLYGGAIQNNSFIKLIENGKSMTLTIDGGTIENNKVIRRYNNYCKTWDMTTGTYIDNDHFINIKNFIIKNGFVSSHCEYGLYLNNISTHGQKSGTTFLTGSSDTIISENSTISGGTLNSKIQTKTAYISGNPSIDDLSCDSASISGGNFGTLKAKDISITGGFFKDVSANNTSVSGKLTINKLTSNKITVSDNLDEDSKIIVSYGNYKINNQQKVFDVSESVTTKDVFHNFTLSNKNYFVNNKGYVDDTPSYKYEITDNSTGIKIESDESITLCNVNRKAAQNVSTFTISQPNDTENDSVHHLNFYINGQLAKSSDINKVAIYVPYTASKLNLNKLNSVKIYNCNNEEMTGCKKTVKSIDGKLYTLITIDNK